jgi:ketosteroid isomerase-like protein
MYGPNGPTVGKKDWEARPEDKALLSWRPSFVDIAASGDWGFDFGPWEYIPNREDGKAVAYGQFVTVWKKLPDGKWTVATDIGISHPQQDAPVSVSTSAIKTVKGSVPDKQELMSMEKRFIQATSADRKKAYSEVLSSEGKLFRKGKFPAITRETIEKILEEDIPLSEFKLVGADASPSGDMAFVYGTLSKDVTIAGEALPHLLTYNFIHIWKKEEGKGWKLVLDILN